MFAWNFFLFHKPSRTMYVSVWVEDRSGVERGAWRHLLVALISANLLLFCIKSLVVLYAYFTKFTSIWLHTLLLKVNTLIFNLPFICLVIGAPPNDRVPVHQNIGLVLLDLLKIHIWGSTYCFINQIQQRNQYLSLFYIYISPIPPI